MPKIVGTVAVVLLCSVAGCESTSSQDKSSQSERQVSGSVSATAESTAEDPSEALSPSENSESDLWSRLQQADTHYVVLVRHALAPGTGDPANFQLGDCATQRNLSEAGRSQARLTGNAFRQKDISVRQVLSSQWCRCLETAELMDLGPVEPFPPLNSFFRDRNSGLDQTAQVRQFILEQPDAAGVTVMVTHFVNISALSGTSVSSGEMVVMQVNDQEELEVIGQLNAL